MDEASPNSSSTPTKWRPGLQVLRHYCRRWAEDSPYDSPTDAFDPFSRNYSKRFFRNETADKFIANPFTSGGLFEEDGHLRQKEKKVGFLELFYDLFFVAALSLFTRESSLTEGIAIANYVVFVTMLFSIWISQTYFDVRFSNKDGLTWFYSFLNLLVYGYIAASSGNFQITYGLFPNAIEADASELQDVPLYVERIGAPEPISGDSIQVSLQAVSAVYAISRLLLALQYGRIFIMARRAKKSTAPVVYSVTGLLLSCACFSSAFGVSFGTITRGKAIARLGLWSLGLTIDFSSLLLSSSTSKAIYYQLEYWAERHAAVVLIVLGEGVIGLFENFRSVYTGPATGFRSALIGQIFAAVGVFRIIYAQYFVGAHSPHIRGGPLTHMVWALLHLPFLLALLLLLRCVTSSLAATETIIAVQIYVTIVDSIDNAVFGLVAQGISVDEYVDTLETTASFVNLQNFTASLGVDLSRSLQTYKSEANGNIQTFVRLYAGTVYSILARIFSVYGYDPSEESYNYVDASLSSSDSPDYIQVFEEDVTMLIRPVYTSVAYGFTVLGGYLIILAALAWLERKPKTMSFKIQYGYRLALGFFMILLTTLLIGHEVTADNLLGRGTPSAPIYKLVANGTFAATIFLVLFSVTLLDLAVYMVNEYRRDQKNQGETEEVALTEGAEDNTEEGQTASICDADTEARTRHQTAIGKEAGEPIATW